MAKYIDVDKVIPTFDKNTWQGDMMISICENAEAEDVAPVVHAKWDVMFGADVFYYCSNCCKKRLERTDYCPNCGAKMDKGD